MDNKKLCWLQLTFLWLFSSATIAAFAPISWENSDISLAVGPSWYHSKDAYMGITSNQVDTMWVRHINHRATYRIGLGHHFFADSTNPQNKAHPLWVQLNLYHGDALLQGDVLEYSSPCCDNYVFRAPVRSTSLMLDVKPLLFTVHSLSTYVIVGAGVAWTRMSLQETAKSLSDAPGTVLLPTANNHKWTYDIGLGVQRQITAHASFTLEYISTFLGKIAPSSQSTSMQTILSAPYFSIYRHNVLFGVNWVF